MTDQETHEFNKLFATAGARLKGVVILDGYRQTKPSFFEKIKINKAIRDFEKCLSIVPDHWQSMFFLAKANQRLGDHQRSLSLLEKAMEIDLVNHNIPQEASIEAVHLNDINKAIDLSNEALRRSPNNFGLMGNQAMNLLIANKDNDAQKMIDDALQLNPKDQINKNIQMLIKKVLAGRQKRPTCKSTIC